MCYSIYITWWMYEWLSMCIVQYVCMFAYACACECNMVATIYNIQLVCVCVCVCVRYIAHSEYIVYSHAILL